MYKAVLSVCALALMVQSIAGACIGAGWGEPFGFGGRLGGDFGFYGGYDGFGRYGGYDGFGGCGWGGYGPASLAASNGGGLEVVSASAFPTGMSVLSENIIEGPLAVTGAVPFLATVGLEGALPTVGAGAVNYGCGNGAVAILDEDINTIGLAGFGGWAGDGFGYGFGPWAGDGFGYGYGPWAGDGFGYGFGPWAGGFGCGGYGYGGYGYGFGGLGPFRAGYGWGGFI